MGRLGRSGFTNTARAELFAYRKREKARIEIYLELDAQSKKRLHTDCSDQQFISGVEKAMKEQARDTPFRAPVAIHMHFHVGVERMPPQIHQLPKHYLDLLQMPIASRPANRRKLLLQDDRLVEALFCSYDFADEEPATPFMTFEVMTLTSFIRDLELHRKIATGDFDDVDGVRELEIRDSHGMGDYEDEYRDDAIDEYRRLVNMGEAGKKQYGEKLYDALLLMNAHGAQRELLRRRELRPIDIATLYGPAPTRKRKDDLFRPLREISAANVRMVTELGVACADLGPPAAQEGDSDVVKGRVREALRKMHETHPLLDPLYSTIGVTVLYVRPESPQQIDLDNLARRFIVPFVHEELKPPATSLHAIQSLKPDGIEDKWVLEGLQRLRRAHKHQITRYQVFSLPRLQDDPPEGKIAVLIHGGDEIDERWNTYRRELDAWESVVAVA